MLSAGPSGVVQGQPDQQLLFCVAFGSSVSSKVFCLLSKAFISS